MANNEFLRVVYRVRASASEIGERAEGLMLEQAVELSRAALRDEFVLREIVGRVEEVAEEGPGFFRVTIGHPVVTTAYDPAQLLNVLFGNSSLQPDVELVDAVLPAGLTGRFPGPQFGIEGLRGRCGAWGRPLTCVALKPMGLSAVKMAELCGIFARAGVDVIKDDHGLAEHGFCPFGERVRLCQAAVEEAAGVTGRRVVYAPNLIGTPERMRGQLEVALGAGVGAVMVEPMLTGMPFLCELAGVAGVPVLAHPAFAGALRIDPVFLLGGLFRLFGADAVIYPNFGGRFSYGRELCGGLAGRLRGEWEGLRPVLPVPAGGIKPHRIGELREFYGDDVMFLMGGGLYEGGDGLEGRAAEFVRSVGGG